MIQRFRRRLTLGALVAGGVAALRAALRLGEARASGQIQRPGPPLPQRPQAPARLQAPTPFRVQAKSFTVSGGSKPGDTVTLRLTVETSGTGPKSVPWTIARDNDVVVKTGTQTNVNRTADRLRLFVDLRYRKT